MVRLGWRSIGSPAYRERLRERFGFYSFDPLPKKSIWVHAVSVGEVIASIPVVAALRTHYPDVVIIMTTMTPTGAARVASAFKDSADVKHVYIPYDYPGAVKRFLSAINPSMAIIMETELWPNLLHQCVQNKIPVCLLNARLSAKSAKGYGTVRALTRGMLRQFALIAAQGQADAQRFIDLGALPEQVKVTGNIKFDLTLPDNLMQRGAELRQQLGNNRFIWIAASTHVGEDEIVLAAHKKIIAVDPNALLILVPRHPERFDSIAKLSAQTFVTSRRSENSPSQQSSQVYLADTMGELLLLYAVADVAFIAGSLIPKGGHNMLEAGAQAKPIITGPHLFNFAEISQLFVEAKALIKVADAESLATEIIRLLHHPEERTHMGKRAFAVVAANRGALAKQLDLVRSVMSDM